MAYEPIPPQRKTVSSANRIEYSVSSGGTAAFGAPTQATSVTVKLGGQDIPSNDSTYPWTLDADGDVVFTGKTPSTNELVTITVDNGQQFLDFTKLKFPSGYALDARVLNRTFLDALYTANKLWTIGDDSITAWGESNNVPLPTADDHFVITEAGGWKSKSKLFTQNLLDIQTGDNLDLTDLRTNVSLSATTLSAVDFQASSFSALSLSGEQLTEAGRTYGQIKFDQDADNPDNYIHAADGSSLGVDVSGGLIFQRFLGNISQIAELNTSGYLGRRAKQKFDQGFFYPDYLTNYISDDKNIFLDVHMTDPLGFENSFVRLSNVGQARTMAKAHNVPVCGFRTERLIDLNFNSYASVDDAYEEFAIVTQSTVVDYRTGAGTNGYNRAFPYLQTARTIALNAPANNQSPFTFNPAFLLDFNTGSESFFKSIGNFDNPNLEDLFFFDGTGRLRILGSSSDFDSHFKLHGRIHFIGSDKYEQLATSYNNSYIGDNYGFSRLPVNNNDFAGTSFSGPYSLAIVEMYKDPDNAVGSEISFLAGGSPGFCTLSLEGVLYLRGDTYYDI